MLPALRLSSPSLLLQGTPKFIPYLGSWQAFQPPVAGTLVLPRGGSGRRKDEGQVPDSQGCRYPPVFLALGLRSLGSSHPRLGRKDSRLGQKGCLYLLGGRVGGFALLMRSVLGDASHDPEATLPKRGRVQAPAVLTSGPRRTRDPGVPASWLLPEPLCSAHTRTQLLSEGQKTMSHERCCTALPSQLAHTALCLPVTGSPCPSGLTRTLFKEPPGLRALRLF